MLYLQHLIFIRSLIFGIMGLYVHLIVILNYIVVSIQNTDFDKPPLFALSKIQSDRVAEAKLKIELHGKFAMK